MAIGSHYFVVAIVDQTLRVTTGFSSISLMPPRLSRFRLSKASISIDGVAIAEFDRDGDLAGQHFVIGRGKDPIARERDLE